MKVKQISLFLENKFGRIVKVTQTLEEAGINIRALSIADTADFGILRMIVNDPEKAYQALKAAGFTVSETEVLAVEIDDQPGGLNKAFNLLEKQGINIEYVYAFVDHRERKAMVVLRVEQLDEATQILNSNGIRTISAADIYSL